MAIGFGLGTGFLHLGGGLDRLRWSLVEALLLLGVVLLAVNLLDLITHTLRRRIDTLSSPEAQMALTALRRAARVTAFAILGLIVLQNMLHLDVTAFVGGIGLVGLALSLAAKDSLQNSFGALMVFMNQEFATGDWIRFRDNIGQVEDVGMQVTRIRLLARELWTVPNMHFIDEPVENLYEREYIRREMNVAIPYELSPEMIEKALSICKDVLEESGIVEEGRFQLDQRPPRISFSHFGDYYLNGRIHYWYFFGDGVDVQRETERGWFEYLEHCQMVNLRLLERFNEEGIEFAYPTSTALLGVDPERGGELASISSATPSQSKRSAAGASRAPLKGGETESGAEQNGADDGGE